MPSDSSRCALFEFANQPKNDNNRHNSTTGQQSSHRLDYYHYINTTMNNHPHQVLRDNLTKLQNLESDLSSATFPHWRALSSLSNNNSSPTSVLQKEELLQRYQNSRSIYLQRRVQQKLLDHVGTFDGTTFEFPDKDVEEEEEDNNNSKDEQDHAHHAAAHDEALAKLQEKANQVQARCEQLQDLYQAVVSRREELEWMVEDVVAVPTTDDDNDAEMEDADNNDNNNDEDEPTIHEEELEIQQARMEQLQQTKRRMQQELASLQEETSRARSVVQDNRHELALLKEQQEEQQMDDNYVNDNKNYDESDLQERISELKEMKAWYDSMRQVSEELSGMRILNVVEVEDERARDDNATCTASATTTTTTSARQLLLLTVQLDDQHEIQFQLAPHRKTSLKLVSAKWQTKPIVYAASSSTTRKISSQDPDDDDDGQEDAFSLALPPLDDLVQVATTTLPPVHDLRFVLRESMARIRCMTTRVNELALLRTHVLTKIHNDQVVCSLNDGIVIVMRLYNDNVVRVEQLAGVSGWDQAAVDQIEKAVQFVSSASSGEHEYEHTSPRAIVELVQAKMQELKNSSGNPPTPKLPKKSHSSQ
jgi:hypothetical protein